MLSLFGKHRALLVTLVKRDLKVRYKASALGFLWSFGRPLALMLILWVVFSHFIGLQTAHPNLPFPLQLLAGILPWMFLTGAVFESQNAIIANENIIKKIRVPSVVFPGACVLSNLVHFFLALGVLFVFILLSPVPFGWEIILLPFLIILQTALLMALALILSSLNVFYRDVGSISEIVVTMWFYLTPIIYPLQVAREKLQESSDVLYYLYMLNPMTPIICGYRRVLYGSLLRSGGRELDDRTLMIGLGVSLVTTVLLLLVASKLFTKLSRRFADEL